MIVAFSANSADAAAPVSDEWIELPVPQVSVQERTLEVPVVVPRTAAPAPVAPPLPPDPYAGVTMGHLLPIGVEGYQQRFEPSPEQLENARRIVEIVKQRRMPAYAAVIALATALQESTLRNITDPVDHDSLGLFQQRPSAGWGMPEQLTDPHYATTIFLDVLERKAPDYMIVPLWQAAQATQSSAFPTLYAQWQEQAAHMVLEILTR
ncbi:hypothetical protein [Nocardia sp. NPDC052566]|uniref:hypothetical protein n=1 Tax=Nocardia sp. NPDC052566 TaxID=3364330 RepID=UPI0037C8F0D4